MRGNYKLIIHVTIITPQNTFVSTCSFYVTRICMQSTRPIDLWPWKKTFWE